MDLIKVAGAFNHRIIHEISILGFEFSRLVLLIAHKTLEGSNVHLVCYAAG